MWRAAIRATPPVRKAVAKYAHNTQVELGGNNAVAWPVRPHLRQKAGMMMFRRKSPLVRIGESFVKAGDPSGMAWKVTRVWTTALGIPHAQIENNCQRKETRIISVSALTDMHFFGPVPRMYAGPA